MIAFREILTHIFELKLYYEGTDCLFNFSTQSVSNRIQNTEFFKMRIFFTKFKNLLILIQLNLQKILI